MSKLVKQKMFVQLATRIDATKFYQMSTSAQIEEFKKPSGNIFFEANSLIDASLMCRRFIDKYNIASSNWAGGKIVDESFNFIAIVSYNGRVWDNEDWSNAKEITISLDNEAKSVNFF